MTRLRVAKEAGEEGTREWLPTGYRSPFGVMGTEVMVHSIMNVLNASEFSIYFITVNFMCILTQSKEGRRKERKQKEKEQRKRL